MRKKMVNSRFTFLYPGLPQQSTADDYERRTLPCIAIPNTGEFVSICGGEYGGEQPSAVFYTVEDLRHLRDALDEAIDLFAEAKAKQNAQRRR